MAACNKTQAGVKIMLCNYCRMKSIEQAAKKANLAVVKQKDPGAHFLPNAVRVLVGPPDIKLDRDRHFTVWFAQLPSTCYC